ncbi:MAG: hypothetical protein ACUVX9_14915 [Anaerolineae bacterium]
MRSRWLVLVLALAAMVALPIAAHADHGRAGYRPVVTFAGTLDSRPEGKVGLWVVGGREVWVGEDTRLIEARGQAVTGTLLLVVARENDQGVAEAETIVVLPQHLVWLYRYRWASAWAWGNGSEPAQQGGERTQTQQQTQTQAATCTGEPAQAPTQAQIHSQTQQQAQSQQETRTQAQTQLKPQTQGQTQQQAQAGSGQQTQTQAGGRGGR